MKPFRDYDLSVVIANQLSAARKKIDTMSNEEIMAIHAFKAFRSRKCFDYSAILGRDYR